MRHGCEEHELAAGNFTHAAAQPVAAEDLLSRASRRPGARDHETKTLKSTSKDHAIAPRPINQGAAQGMPALFCLEMIGASAGCHPQHQALARAQPRSLPTRTLRRRAIAAIRRLRARQTPRIAMAKRSDNVTRKALEPEARLATRDRSDDSA